MKSSKLSSLFFVACIILSSCEQATPTPPGGDAVQTIVPGSVAPEIVVNITNTEVVELTVEVVKQQNCGGSAETENEHIKSHSVEHIIEAQGGFSVNVNGDIKIAGTGVGVGATVATQLGHAYGTVEVMSRSLTVKAKPGTNMEHSIRQTEVWKVGTARVKVGDEEVTIPFRFRHDFAIELVDSRDIGCASLPETITPTATMPQPTVTSTSTATAQPSVGAQPTQSAGSQGDTGWQGEYFDNNKFQQPAVFTRLDPAPIFDWKDGNPSPGVPIDYFSVRWTRCLTFEDRYYVFTARADDVVQVFVDNLFVLEAGSSNVERAFAVSAGQHCIKVEFKESWGNASVYFDFQPGEGYQSIGENDGWKGEYFNNNKFQEPSTHTRYDAAPVFNWKDSNAAPDIPIDYFSVRWTRCFMFENRYYVFTARADDVVQVFVDDLFVLEAGGSNVERAFAVSAGQHCVKIELKESWGNASVYFDFKPGEVYQGVGENDGWKGEYFNNNKFQEPAAYTWYNAAPVFNWKDSNPAPGVSIDYFSVRWTRCMDFDGREYVFTARADDIVQVFVDNLFVLEAGSNNVERAFVVSAGRHCIKIEFKESWGNASVYFDFK